MALKPTIYKFNVALSDLNRDYYDSLNLTVALHPSESEARMMVRLLAFCLNAQDNLSFTKGLSAVDEPDIIVQTLDDQAALWIDVGEPSTERVKKATRIANDVHVYCFNSKAPVWWEQHQTKFAELPVNIYKFEWEAIQRLSSLLRRTMNLSVTLTGSEAYIASEDGECEVSCTPLQLKQ